VGKFLDKLHLTHIDGETWQVDQDMRHQAGEKYGGRLTTVKAGFLTDGASIPWWARPLIGPKTGEYFPAAGKHDWLFQYPADGCGEGEEPRDRKQVDREFLEAMQDLKVSWWKRTLMYSAVRVGGKGPWRSYRERDPIPPPSPPEP